MHDTQHDVMMRLNVLERRVTALESEATDAECPEVEPTEEDAAIARVRKWVGDQLASAEVRVLLAALDRARQERDDARAEAAALVERPTVEPSEEDRIIERWRGFMDRERATGGLWTMTTSEIRHVLAALDRVTADARSLATRTAIAEAHQIFLHATMEKQRQERDDARSELAAARALTIALRAQLAARTDAKPMGWVNLYDGEEGRTVFRNTFRSHEEAQHFAAPNVLRTVPVFEHPPVAPLVTGTFTDAEIEEAIRTGWANFGLDGNQNALVDEMQSALRPLFDRAARGPVVGACVVRESGNVSATFTYDTNQTVNEGRAVREAEEYGGIAYLLHRGDVIGGEK